VGEVEDNCQVRARRQKEEEVSDISKYIGVWEGKEEKKEMKRESRCDLGSFSGYVDDLNWVWSCSTIQNEIGGYPRWYKL